MLTTIHITVRDRVPTITAGEDVISHNSDYVAEFEFDEEWQDKVKTVYFVCEDGSYQAVVMSGNSCGVPMLDGEHRRIFVGVQAGAAEKPSVLKTTRPCCLKVKDSIADYLGQPIPDPTPSVYEQIIAMLESITTPTWGSLQNKPFSTLGSGLAVDENGVLSAQGGGSSAFYINITSTTDDSGDTMYSADKTAAEIYEALNAKVAMYVVEEISNTKIIVPFFNILKNNTSTILGFANEVKNVSITLTHNNGEPTIDYIGNYDIARYALFNKFDNEDGSVSIEPLSGAVNAIIYDLFVPAALTDDKTYSLSTRYETDAGVVLCFDDISGKKVRKVTIDATTSPETITYSEEPLSTSVNIVYNEETGNLQIGG